MPDMIVEESFLRDEHGIVAEEAGVPLGYAIVRIDGDEAFVRDLFVDPDRFGQGVGRALFAECVSYARANGATRLKLESDPNAEDFYARMGMRRVAVAGSSTGGGRVLPVM